MRTCASQTWSTKTKALFFTWKPLIKEVRLQAAFSTKVHCPAAGILPDAPTIGLVLQKSHIATKDDGHYVT